MSSVNKQPWFKHHPEFLSLALQVKPGNKQNRLFFDETGSLNVAVRAAAQDGQANKMLINYLAKLLCLPKKTMVIHRGGESRHKVIRIAMPDVEQHALVNLLSNLMVKNV